MKLLYISVAGFILQVHSLCVDTRQRVAQGWNEQGVLTIEHCREECGYKKYIRFSMECPRKDVSERGRSQCWCLNSLDRSYDIPEENCNGNSSFSPSIGNGQQHHCNGPYKDSYGRNLGGWSRGAVYSVKGHNLCVDTRQRDAQGWRMMGEGLTIDDCRRECNYFGYDKFSMECPTVTSADDTAICYCLNYLRYEDIIPDENCFGNADATQELNDGKNGHCTGPYTDCHGRSLGGWHRGAVYRTKELI